MPAAAEGAAAAAAAATAAVPLVPLRTNADVVTPCWPLAVCLGPCLLAAAADVWRARGACNWQRSNRVSHAEHHFKAHSTVVTRYCQPHTLSRQCLRQPSVSVHGDVATDPSETKQTAGIVYCGMLCPGFLDCVCCAPCSCHHPCHLRHCLCPHHLPGWSCC